MIEAVCGCMFAGKTDELFRRLRKEEFARRSFVILRPTTDTRTLGQTCISHNSQSMPAVIVKPTIEGIAPFFEDAKFETIALDEAQFFAEAVPTFIDSVIRAKAKRVIAAGLDLDFLGHPFPTMATFLALATTVTKLTAVCTRCSGSATRSHRKFASQTLVEIGGADKYEPLCWSCWVAASFESFK